MDADRKWLVLMYHRINDLLPPGELVVPVERFREQMEYLKRQCRVVDLNELLQGEFKRSTVNDKLQQPLVVITFDDGYRDNYLNAYPVLKELGLPAAIFLTTGMISTDKKRPRYQNMPDPDMLSWDEAREMTQSGIAFGPHTASHPHLSQLGYEEQRREIKDSIDILSHQVTGSPVTGKIFCYPYGDYNNDTLEVLKGLGVKMAFTVNPGVNDGTEDPLELRRIGICGTDTLDAFKEKTG